MHWLRDKMHKLGCALESPRLLGKIHMLGPQGQSRASGYLNLSRRFQGAAKFEDHGTPVWRGWRLVFLILSPSSRSPESSALGQGKERKLGNFLSSSSNQQFWSQIRLLNLFTSETQTLTCLFFSPGLTHRVSHSEPC